jgi:hypothetical protein
MTSESKIAANRRNGRKSRGPRTAAGKSIASRNALRHGFAAATPPSIIPPVEIERFARALCGNDPDPALYQQAAIIAKNAWLLRAIEAQQLAVIERLREPTAIALAEGDNSLQLGKARSKETRQAYDERDALVGKLLQKYKAELPPSVIANFERRMLEKTLPKPKRKRRLRNKPSMTQTDFASFDPLRITDFEFFIPLELHILLCDKEGELDSIELPADSQSPTPTDIGERRESAALEEAVLDLVRLDRYQRRAWSGQKGAIRDFIRIKSFRGHPAAGSSVSQH